ncbi:membrane protein insertase YidC [Acidihalobacter ferrooxydans]|uniref:Membrane protein insertase YidC n=1 Tax=Acidihalobacter ferrooxydans TaxID=1765967 RepID=A0A1P8UKS9_9GAMM|nr:membrane protein insertase YidC [Acidihalobacter ferrooxydans]APZ44433.1 membrane protein insertase YidC [Acidihalobacter ferrooxydans]
MDNLRPLLYISLVFVLFLIWQAWQQDHRPPPSPQALSQQTTASPNHTQDIPSASVNRPTRSAATPPSTASQSRAGRIVHIKTDTLDLEIDTRGAGIVQALLPTYPVAVSKPHDPYPLMYDTANAVFVAQSGLLSADNSSATAPNHYALYTAAKSNYVMSNGEKTLSVPFTWVGPNGVKVTKTYVFHRGSFVVNVNYTIHNTGHQNWSGSAYAQIKRSPSGQSYNLLDAHSHSYLGAAYYDGSYQKSGFDGMAKNPLSKTVKDGWVAMVEHYFLVAWIPPRGVDYQFYTRAVHGQSGEQYLIGFRSPTLSLAPGQSSSLDTRMWVGPELQGHLAQVAPGLDLTTGYGIFTFIAKPLYWLLSKIHSFVGNWGWSIIILTLLIKLAFYKLSETSYRSMARMRTLQPKMKALKDRFGDDRQKLSQATMELYKKEKVNPLGGCLPMIVQIPVFIALYWVLLESVELRQAPFIFWIHNLAAKDPYYVLPLLMGVTMFLQQRLNPAPLDPLQKKVMSILPLAFTVFFAFFPSGLVLYWLTNNILSIAQQWVITKRIEKAAAAVD